MSRRVMWFVLAISICVALGLIAYSMQAPNVNGKGDAPGSSPAQSQQQQSGNNGQTGEPKQGPEKGKDPDAPKELCTLNPEQSPDIRGVKLGMSLKQVLAVFPGSGNDSEILSYVSKPSQFGEIRFIIAPGKYGSKENFVGIKTISIGFLDERVSDLNVGYDGPAWKHVDEFVTKFSEGKTLPGIDAWEGQVGMDTQLKILKCDGFEIDIFAGGKGGKSNYVQMRDLSAEKELEERRAKFLEKAGKQAKP